MSLEIVYNNIKYNKELSIMFNNVFKVNMNNDRYPCYDHFNGYEGIEYSNSRIT